MSKFKVGDEVVLVASEDNPSVLKNGATGVVLDINTAPYVQFNIEKSDELHDAEGLGEDGKCWAVTEDEIELIKTKYTPSFKASNRYKLHKYILSTGFTKQDLSLALNKNQSYLTTETRESQFINRGDMSDARYKSLRKQIKESVYKITTEFANSVPTNVGISGGEVNQTLAEVEPKAKEYLHYDSSVGLSGGYGEGVYVIYDGEIVPAAFAVAMDMKQKTLDEKVKEAKEALDTFTVPKSPNNGAFILGLVFFVMLIIFGIGCLIYKAA